MLEFPEEMQYVWEYFIDLDSARSSNGFGPNNISWNEMQSYFSLRRIIPSDQEIRIIRMLDNIAMKHYSDEIEKKNKSK